MKKHFDFTLSEESFPDSELILRIYPVRSRCHVFDPKKENTTIRDIYKTYMYWSIFRRFRSDDGKVEKSSVMFDSSCDECSILVEGGLRYILKGVLYKRPTDVQSLLPMGDGVSWEIKRGEMDRSFLDDDDMDEEEKAEYMRLAYFDPYCIFSVFRTWDGVGYRFTVLEKRLPELIAFLEEVEKYMLDHSVEI